MDEEKVREQEHFSNEEIEENSLSESSEELSFNGGLSNFPDPLTVNALTPKVGMTFRSVDEAYEFYSYYAYRIGFGIAKTCSRRKDGIQHEYTFSCEKSGKPKDKKGTTPKRARISKKTGCQAKFRVRINDEGLWHLAFLVLHHNHYCSPSESHHYRSHKFNHFRSVPVVDQRLLEGISPVEASLNINQQNLLSGHGEFWLGEGDVEAITDYFRRIQKEDPFVFHSMDFDSESRLRNVFWADARSRMLYPYFNDVILFDTKCNCRKNGSIPFVAFTGVNHHGSTMFFGGALLSEERPETYAWLLKTWLDSMNGLAPKTVITDKSKSIDSAVLEVFPNTLHRLCVWQIMRKIPEELAGRLNQNAAKERLYDVVFDSQTTVEFEANWADMVEEFKLRDNEWFISLYEERRRWVPAFVKDTFWAGVSGIQRSDPWVPLFDRFVTSKSNLKQFFSAYEAALQAKYNREVQEDLESQDQSQFSFISRLSMEEDFSKSYTLNMFQRFQRELQKCVDCTCVLIRKDGAVSIYQVKERVKQRTYSYEVLFNEDQVEVQCLCRGFEFGGILCAHAIVVLKEKDVQRAPPRYICHRWKKDCKQESPRHCLLNSDFLALQPCKRFERLVIHCLPHLWKLAEIGVLSNSQPEKLLRLLAKMERKLANSSRIQKEKGSTWNGDSARALHVNGLPKLNSPDNDQMVDEDASQQLAPYYLSHLVGQQQPALAAATTSIPLSISSSSGAADFWGQKETMFPSISQLRNP